MRVLVLVQEDQTDRARMATAIRRYATDSEEVDAIFFGITEGTAANVRFLVSCAVEARAAVGSPPLYLVTPHRLDSLPADARHAAAECAGVHELLLGEGIAGYNTYASLVVEVVRDLGQVVLLWDGRYTQEPWDTVRWLHVLSSCGYPLAPDTTGSGCVLAAVPFELYSLRRPDAAPLTRHR